GEPCPETLQETAASCKKNTALFPELQKTGIDRESKFPLHPKYRSLKETAEMSVYYGFAIPASGVPRTLDWKTSGGNERQTLHLILATVRF
ncbi:hypothetical protein, partial [Akkermansia sp.]